MSNSGESESNKVRAIVIGHGDFSAGLVSAVDQICGMAGRLVGLSMMGLTPEDIETAIRAELARTGAHVIFTDLLAGSATLGARRIVKEDSSMVLVSGVNLPTLLDFVFNTEVSPIEAARSSTDRGNSSLIVVERS